MSKTSHFRHCMKIHLIGERESQNHSGCNLFYQKKKKINEADAISDQAKFAMRPPVAVERKRTKNFQIPKSESKLRDSWYFVYMKNYHFP